MEAALRPLKHLAVGAATAAALSLSGVASAAAPDKPAEPPAPQEYKYGDEEITTERLVPPVMVLEAGHRRTSSLITIRGHFLDALLRSTEDLGF